jgi:hypothetical protein
MHNREFKFGYQHFLLCQKSFLKVSSKWLLKNKSDNGKLLLGKTYSGERFRAILALLLLLLLLIIFFFILYRTVLSFCDSEEKGLLKTLWEKGIKSADSQNFLFLSQCFLPCKR